MEDLLIVIFQFFFEMVLQVLAELPWDVWVGSRQSAVHCEPGPGLWIVLSLIAGGCVGGASLLIFPTTLLHWGSARMANLVVAPFTSAFVSHSLSRWSRSRRGNEPYPKIRTVCAACFTFALAVIRFTYATRQHG